MSETTKIPVTPGFPRTPWRALPSPASLSVASPDLVSVTESSLASQNFAETESSRVLSLGLVSLARRQNPPHGRVCPRLALLCRRWRPVVQRGREVPDRTPRLSPMRGRCSQSCGERPPASLCPALAGARRGAAGRVPRVRISCFKKLPAVSSRGRCGGGITTSLPPRKQAVPAGAHLQTGVG